MTKKCDECIMGTNLKHIETCTEKKCGLKQLWLERSKHLICPHCRRELERAEEDDEYVYYTCACYGVLITWKKDKFEKWEYWATPLGHSHHWHPEKPSDKEVVQFT